MSTLSRRHLLALLPLVAASACSAPVTGPGAVLRRAAGDPPLHPNETPQVRALINKWSDHYAVPRDLVHAQVKRESGYRADVRAGPYYGLMQLLPQTARTMGFTGPNEGLLDPDVNLRYGVKYLRGAYMVAGGDKSEAMHWYARGYYYEAKRLGLLEETGLV